MREYLRERNGVWHYRRRVPADVAHLDPRGEVRVTTKRRDYAEAVIIAKRINDEAESFWAALSAGTAATRDQAAERFDRAVRLARTLGVSYRPVEDLASGDVEEIVRRLELLEGRKIAASRPAQEAVLGGADKPVLRLSGLFAAYEDHARDRLRGKSDDQVRKWKNPRRRAIANAVAVIGDKPVAALLRDDDREIRDRQGQNLRSVCVTTPTDRPLKSLDHSKLLLTPNSGNSR